MDANDKASIEQRLRALKDTLASISSSAPRLRGRRLEAETLGSLYIEDGVSTPQAVAKSSTGPSAEQQSER